MNEENNINQPGSTPPEPPAPQPVEAAGSMQPPAQTAPYDGSQQPYGTAQQSGPQGTPPMPQSGTAPYCQPAAPQTNGKAIGALVCGILAILGSPSIIISVALGIVAIVLAGKAVKESGPNGKATGGKVCGIIGIVLSVLSLIMYIVLGIGIVAFMASESAGSTYSSSSDVPAASEPRQLNEEENQAKATLDAELAKLQNKDEASVQEIAAMLEASFSDELGFSSAEMGIDFVESVRWSLDDFSYEITDVYVFESDGTGSVYADISMRDLYSFSETFNSEVEAFLATPEASTMDQTALFAKMGDLYRSAMDKSIDTTQDYLSVDVINKEGTWTIDKESWADGLDYLFGIY